MSCAITSLVKLSLAPLMRSGGRVGERKWGAHRIMRVTDLALWVRLWSLVFILTVDEMRYTDFQHFS